MVGSMSRGEVGSRNWIPAAATGQTIPTAIIVSSFSTFIYLFHNSSYMQMTSIMKSENNITC